MWPCLVPAALCKTPVTVTLYREGMAWAEFCDLLSGIDPDTALGKVVSIRAEEDKEVLKHFTPEQKRIRSEWRKKSVKYRTADEMAQFLSTMQNVFANMAKGGDTPSTQL